MSTILRDLHNEDPRDGEIVECPLCEGPARYVGHGICYCRFCGEVDPANLRSHTNEPEPTEETEA